MPININVKTKIKINGKEYNIPEEMPGDVRIEIANKIGLVPLL
jgi:hypothetical protein